MTFLNMGGVHLSLLASALLAISSSSFAGDSTNLGDGSTAGSSYATGVGYNAKAEGTFSTALGAETHAEGYGSTAVGNTAFSTGKYSVSIGSYVNSDNDGYSAVPSGDQSVAIGLRAKSQGTNSTASGAYSNASASNSTAVGYNAKATVKDGVAIGSGSVASRASGQEGYVPGGMTLTDEEKNSATWKSTKGEVSVGSEGVTRQITHVAAGSEDTDAVNVAQLKAVNQNITNNFEDQLNSSNKRFEERFNSMSSQFNERMDNLQDDANAGIAMAIAVAGLPQAYQPGKSMIAVAAGTYLGEQGYAVGISHIMENGHVVLKVTGSGNSQGHFGGSVGAGYQW